MYTSKGKPYGKSYGGCSYRARYSLQRYRKNIIYRWKRRKGCKVCGYNTNPIALDLDHRNPEDKTFTIGSRAISHKKWDTVKIELSYCDVLCKNCHAIKTYNNKDTYKKVSQYA